MVKVIYIRPHHGRRRMVQSYSPGGANVPSHDSTLAPPDEYASTCASFGPPESPTRTANRSVQRFCTAHGRKFLYITMGALSPLKLPLPMEASGPPSNT